LSAHHGTEYRVARHGQLIPRILREVLARVLLYDLLVVGDDRLQIVRIQICVELRLDLRLALIKDVIERFHLDPEGHFAEHLNEATIAVVSEPRIAGQLTRPSVVSSFKPRLRIVFIMPGMENFAPERTLISSGFFGSPSFCRVPSPPFRALS
jgi:hypothetical protein